jgi:hypothetical protein
MNAIAILGGLGGAGVLKAFLSRQIANEWFSRLYGVGAIVLGAIVNTQAKRKELKAVGTGMVVFGIYDALTSNIPQLAQFLPTIGAPTAFLTPVDGYMDYGRSVMGASIGSGQPIETVGATNISMDAAPEIVGSDMDLADALEMAV